MQGSPLTPEAPLPLGFAFELDQTAYELPPGRRRPRSFMHAYIFRVAEDHYWDRRSGWRIGRNGNRNE